MVANTTGGHVFCPSMLHSVNLTMVWVGILFGPLIIIINYLGSVVFTKDDNWAEKKKRTETRVSL